MKFLPLFFLSFMLAFNTYSACTKDQAKASVEKICKLIASKGDAAIAEIKRYRYCGSNYVWVQDKDVKMVIHPIKGRLNGRDLTKIKDKKGMHIFVEFDKAAKANKDGSWVNYFWTKPGDEAPSPKTSFVKICEGGKQWIAGSGVWGSH